MLVKELIKKLEEFNQDLPIVVKFDNDTIMIDEELMEIKTDYFGEEYLVLFSN